MKRKHKYLAGAVTGVLMGALLALAAPSAANASLSQCPDGNLCVWTGANFDGKIMVLNGPMETLPNNSTVGYWNDAIGSAWNRTGRTVCMHEHSFFGGNWYFFGPNTLASNMGNRTSSIRFDC
jgi:Peptidase inhibitor family I36